jgi:putative glutamine amidotransferase
LQTDGLSLFFPAMKTAPLILIFPGTRPKGYEFGDFAVDVSERYAQAILAAGGFPLVASCAASADYVAECLRRGDGVLLTGGEDVNPALHAPDAPADLRATVKSTEPERDLFEAMLIPEIFRQRKPLFAICRGQQMLNVSFGGTLFVDIPTQVPGALPHRQFDRKDEPVHPVNLAADSRLARLLGATAIQVNSTHHQAVDRVAPPFRAVGTAPDGVVEALELAPAEAGLLPWFLSVQFHPERLSCGPTDFRVLFRDFVQASAAHRE